MPTADSQSAVFIPRNGMTFAEFRQAKPGILPATILYNGNVAQIEKLYQIEGQWVWDFRDGLLSRIVFLSHSPVYSQEAFQTWLSSAKIVVQDFVRSFGRPATQLQGESRYFDPNDPKFPNPTQRRHVYQEATWSIAGTEIRIICEIKSNRADDPADQTYSEDSSEYWTYEFQVDVQTYTTVGENAPVIYGRSYLGMTLDAFAIRFPALFSQGTAPSGNWTHKEDWQGLHGEWSYAFMHGKLIQFQYMAYFQNEQINEASFQLCKKAALAIVEELKPRYGKPNEYDASTIGFRLPRKKKNTYYDVVTAQWNAVEGMRVRVEFLRFYGGDDYENFSVNVTGTDKAFAGYE